MHLHSIPGLFALPALTMMLSSVLLFVGAVAAQEDPCPNIVSVPSSGRFVYKQSAPLRSGGPGTPLIGYRKEPTLIMSRRSDCTVGTFKVYDKDGTRLFNCPKASAHDFACRARCTKQTASARRMAVRNTGSPKIRFKLNSTTCAEVTDAGRCYGSSKGLCNQLIR